MELTEQQRQQVFKALEGMDQKYTNIVREFHKIYNDEEVTQEAKKKRQAQAFIKIVELKHERFDEAIEILEGFKNDYIGIPSAEVPGNTNERIAYELERANTMKVWQELLENGTAQDIRSYYDRVKADTDFRKMLEVAFRKRSRDGELQKFKHELQNPEYPVEIDTIIQAFQFFRNNRDKYFQGLAKISSLNEYSTAKNQRDINEDLVKYANKVSVGGISQFSVSA